MHEVFLEIRNQGVLPLSPPMRLNPKRKQMNEYYKYYRVNGHDTKDC